MTTLAQVRSACLGAWVAFTLAASAQAPAGGGTGGWPAADAAEITRLIDGFLGPDRTARATHASRALLVPHVTDGDSGAVAGKAFAQCPRDIDRVILLAAGRPAGTVGATGPQGLSRLPAWDSMRTALGDAPVDAQAVQECRAHPGMAAEAEPGGADQAMASVLPFLQRRLSRPFRLVPVAVDAEADPALLVQALLPLFRDERTAVVALTPGGFGPAGLETLFSPADDALAGGVEALPAHLLAMRSLAAEMGWKPVVVGHQARPDGVVSLSALLVDDPNRTDLLAQAAKATWDDPLTQAAFADAGRAAGRTNFQGDLLSQPEQEVLLWLARKTLTAKLKGEPLPAAPLYSDTLSVRSGCFVSLTQGGKLRGSIGTIVAKDPLAAAVQRNALAAALEDKRFKPLTVEDLPSLEIGISVVTPLRKLQYRDGQDLLDQLKPGVHGVLLTYEASKRATFLPQVWGQLPEKTAFLKALCRKGGIPLDAWQDPAKTTVEVYESFDFAEKPR